MYMYKGGKILHSISSHECQVEWSFIDVATICGYTWCTLCICI